MHKTMIGVFAAGVLIGATGPAQAAGQSSPAAGADKIPLDKVCVQRSNLYSPGAIIKMNNKPYVCKKDPKGKSDELKWMPKKKKS